MVKNGKSYNFEKLKEEVAIYERLGVVIILGDTNARVGLNKDFIVDDEIDEFLTLPDNYISDNEELLTERKSRINEFDAKSHANELLSFCKMTRYRIANGRLSNDKEGNFTCYKPNGNSTVDYLLVKEKDFDKISDFEIGELNGFSDHCYLSLKIKAKVQTDEVCNENIDSELDGIETSTLDENLEKLKGSYDCKFKYVHKDREKKSKLLLIVMILPKVCMTSKNPEMI